ncbi:MAG: hypothetical protein ACJ8CB_31760, partial [Ktedonobacteraceae bacterium]
MVGAGVERRRVGTLVVARGVLRRPRGPAPTSTPGRRKRPHPSPHHSRPYDTEPLPRAPTKTYT